MRIKHAFYAPTEQKSSGVRLTPSFKRKRIGLRRFLRGVRAHIGNDVSRQPLVYVGPTIAPLTRSCSRSKRRSVRSASRVPPLYGFRATRAFPSAVRGPVAFSHGRQFRISADCRARRRSVQPFAILRLQKFALRAFDFPRARIAVMPSGD